MVYSRGKSGPLPFTTTESHNAQRRLPFRSNSQTSSDAGRARVGMAIPGVRVDDVPPALPPPRYNHDLDCGYDLAWSWQNQDHPNGQRALAPIKPGSSLLGGRTLVQLLGDEDGDIDMEMDVDASHLVRQMNQFASQSPLAGGTPLPSLTRRGLSPPGGINQGLHGENPLAQQSHDESTKTYDKNLLLKIGKSQSPLKDTHCHLKDSGGSIRKICVQTKGSGVAYQSTRRTTSSNSVTKWMTSPLSGVSSNSKIGLYEGNMDSRSPALKSTSRSYTLESDSSPPSQPHSKSLTSSNQAVQPPHQVEHQLETNSYDASVNPGDLESTGDEVGLRNLRRHERPVGVVMHGTKRRALSPLPKVEHEQKQEQGLPPTYDGRTGLTGTHSRLFEAPSLSSTVSSGPQSSFTSSHRISPSSGSLTSFSSLSYGLSTTSDSVQPRSWLSIAQAQDDPGVTSTDFQSDTNLAQLSQSSTSTPVNETAATPSRVGHHYLCSCCPKKPRKFESKEQLRAHENEKQYTCAFCNNRFKNKNEAERHQNSLHLRRQSWSCSAISTYQAAFYSSELFNPRNFATDTCGFCGQEFDKHPANWEERIEHLTNTHKFGECNATKKFYRADHFRQHLKHSHAGRSGKWTNILENSCLREGAPSEPAGLSPTASEHLQSGSAARLQASLSNPADAYECNPNE